MSIYVNGIAVKSNYKVKPNDLIKILLSILHMKIFLPEKIDLDIVYEDDDLVVINKPAGLVFIPVMVTTLVL